MVHPLAGSFLPGLPPLLVVEVSWAERSWAERLLAAPADSVPRENMPDPVVVRASQSAALLRRVRGIPVARLEKVLVDASQLPELAPATTDAALTAAANALQAHHGLNWPLLLQYAARREAQARWETLFAQAASRG
ncbi:DUF6577 family protein [Hymenobacter humi]|uniref:DUF6577 family protein n=1 Tax=Hymenobacter humi TaxID=1411620 RepID=A0ABW2UDZ1_9BACT